MSIETELALLANTKESLRLAIGLSTSIPFSQYAANIPWGSDVIPATGTVFDFQKNRYAKGGKAVYLDDVSEFIRLSSATMWHDGQLVEVQDSMPRISSAGLLVENSVTESIPNNSTITSTDATWVVTSKTDQNIGSVFEFVSDGSDSIIRTDIPTYPAGNVDPNSGYYYRSILAKKTPTDSFLLFGSSQAGSTIMVNLKNGSVDYMGGTVVESEISDIGEYYLIEILTAPLSSFQRQFVLYASNNPGSGGRPGEPTTGHKVTVALPSYRDTADFPQSFVKTSGTQVTRSPDILNIPLLPTQTLSGDWDEGVTYEVADNIATFTGHGYIRNITVGAL